MKCFRPFVLLPVGANHEVIPKVLEAVSRESYWVPLWGLEIRNMHTAFQKPRQYPCEANFRLMSREINSSVYQALLDEESRAKALRSAVRRTRTCSNVERTRLLGRLEEC